MSKNISISKEVAEHYAKLIPVQAVKDDSGHWYVIPAHMAEEFSRLLDYASDGGDSDNDDFIEKFSQYRTGGDLNNTQLYAKRICNACDLENKTCDPYGCEREPESLTPAMSTDKPGLKKDGDGHIIYPYSMGPDSKVKVERSVIDADVFLFGHCYIETDEQGNERRIDPLRLIKHDRNPAYKESAKSATASVTPFDCTKNQAPMLPIANDDELKALAIQIICRLLDGVNVTAVEKVAVSNFLIQVTSPQKPSALEMVEEFHQVFNVPVLKTPTIPLIDRQELRERLIKEEFSELMKAVYICDMVGILDGLCDLLYVVYGTAHEFGLGPVLEQAIAEVHRSNMSKLNGDGTPIVRNDGKVLKGPNFTPPNLSGIINKFISLASIHPNYPGISAELGANMPEPTGTGVIYSDLKKEPPTDQLKGVIPTDFSTNHVYEEKSITEMPGNPISGSDTPGMKAAEEFKENPPNIKIDENY